MKKAIKEQTEEVKQKVKKLGPVKLTILAIMAVATICSFVLYDYIFGSKSVFVGAVTGSDFINNLWWSMPKIIRAIQAITIICIIATILNLIVKKLFVKSRREVTVANLLFSVIKWISVIVLIITVLAIWGVDTTALITGAGVITLIVGLGMQSLIADVVAGLFIVFENEFNVGDIITVDGFRGEVISIGIRTTKLKAAGNIKIFNNSEIKGVLNQTVEPSTAKAFISIEYGESLARVEEIIKENLSKIEIKGVLGGLSYDGVDELGASAVTLRFSAECYEGDIFDVQRDMNKHLKNMFDQHGINIPFNQLVIHSV